MDNCQIHHSPAIRELIHSYGTSVELWLLYILNWNAGCRVEYLPPYSPDLNPIELAFGILKAHLKAEYSHYLGYQNPYYILYEACSIIDGEIAEACIEHCGYY
jgi:transposase